MSCPYCESENVEEVNTTDAYVGRDGGSVLSEYICNDCEEYFYVEFFLAVVEYDIRKNKRR